MSMKKKVFNINKELESSLGFAQAVQAGDFLFVSGTVSSNDELQPLEMDNIEGQYRVIYEKLKRTLDAYDLNFNDVVKENIYTEDLEAFFETGNAVRMEYYQGLDQYPAATAVECTKIAFDGNLVEIELVAYFKG
ncbi:Rid family hydrolase [Gammaproteobacteria bacterium]|nr:Rid family hydrolase [Gammaproteobacteria bacterium]